MASSKPDGPLAPTEFSWCRFLGNYAPPQTLRDRPIAGSISARGDDRNASSQFQFTARASA